MTAVTRPTFAFRPSISFALAAVMLILLCTSAAAQDTTGVGVIGGVVVNAVGQPAEGVRVCALDTSSCATSDARGVFRIGELRSGVPSSERRGEDRVIDREIAAETGHQHTFGSQSSALTMT